MTIAFRPCRHWYNVPINESKERIPHILAIANAEEAIDKLLIDPYTITALDLFALGRLNTAAHEAGFSPAVVITQFAPPELIPEFEAAYCDLKRKKGGEPVSAMMQGAPLGRFVPADYR